MHSFQMLSSGNTFPKREKRKKAASHNTSLLMPPFKAYLLYKVLREGNKCESDTGNYGTRQY